MPCASIRQPASESLFLYAPRPSPPRQRHFINIRPRDAPSRPHGTPSHLARPARTSPETTLIARPLPWKSGRAHNPHRTGHGFGRKCDAAHSSWAPRSPRPLPESVRRNFNRPPVGCAVGTRVLAGEGADSASFQGSCLLFRPSDCSFSFVSLLRQWIVRTDRRLDPDLAPIDQAGKFPPLRTTADHRGYELGGHVTRVESAATERRRGIESAGHGAGRWSPGSSSP